MMNVGHAAECPRRHGTWVIESCICDYDSMQGLAAEVEQLHSAIKLLTAPFENHCGDGSCIFGPPHGMHTNGGCRCFKYLDHHTERQLKRIVLTLRRRNAAQEQLKTLRRLSDAYMRAAMIADDPKLNLTDAMHAQETAMGAGQELARFLEEKS